jgi:AcrR family transcriptional regulator
MATGEKALPTMDHTDASADRRQASRKWLASEATRAAILDAAMAEFAGKGLAGARVDEIARQTETSKHMIYYHFGSKERLYEAVLKLAYDQFQIAEQAIDYEALDPVAAMRSLIEATFDMHAAHPDSVRIIMGENINNGDHIGNVPGLGARRAILETIGAIVSRGAATGVFRESLDPLQIHMTASALSFYCISNRFTFGQIFEIDYEVAEVLARRRHEIVETVLRYCLNDVV